MEAVKIAPPSREISRRIRSITKAWIKHLSYLRETHQAARKADGKPERPTRAWASGWSPCTREIALTMMKPENRDEPDDEGKERMQRGEDRQESILARLTAAGKWATPVPFKVEGGQFPFKIEDPDTPDPRDPSRPLVIASGKLEGWIKFEDGFRAPFEVKAGRTFQSARTAEDLDFGKWTRGAVPQLLTGLTAVEEAVGFILTDRHGLPGMLPVVYDHNRAAGILGQFREATLARLEAAPVPEPIEYQSDVCGRCPHLGKDCDPPGWKLTAADVIHDRDLEEALRYCHENPTAAKDYKRNWDFAREKLHGIDRAMVGPIRIEASWAKKTIVEVPEGSADARQLKKLEDWVARIKKKHSTTDKRGTYKLKIVGVDS